MTPANPLVAEAQDTATQFSGMWLVTDANDIASSIQSGDWASSALSIATGALDAAAAIVDPIGTLIGHGLGWVLDHIEPLKGWLNDFTGSAGEVQAFAQTWTNAAGALRGVSDQYASSVNADVADMSGATIDAYVKHAGVLSEQLKSSANWADAISSGLSVASQIVQLVHDVVRDAISQIVGTVTSAGLFTLATAGFGAPVAGIQIGARVASLASKVGKVIDAALSALHKLEEPLKKLAQLAEDIAKKVSSLVRGGRGADAPSAPHAGGGKPDADAPNKPKNDEADEGKPSDDDADAPKDEDEPVIDPNDDRPYLDPNSRPSFRKGVVEDVWNAHVGPDGKVIDPAGRVIEWTPGTPRKGVWDMGHIPEAKYHDVWKSYVNGEMTPAEFRDWYNDPDNYRPEHPTTNRGHQHE